PEETFWKELADAAELTPTKDIYFYVHGFALSGTNAIYTGSVLASQLGSPVVVYTWPSKGDVGILPKEGLIQENYKIDVKMIEQPMVKKDFATFLTRVEDFRSKHPDLRINLMAHSLGNFLLFETLKGQNDFPKYHRVFFLSPYFDAGDFAKNARQVLK